MKYYFAFVFFFICHCSYAENEFIAHSSKISLPSGWALGEAVAIAQDNQANTFIFNRGNHQLLKFDKFGNYLTEFGHGHFDKPHGMRIDRHGNIWTTDTNNHLVLRFSPEGKVTMVLGMKNKASKGWFDRDYNLALFNSPHDVAFDNFDNIYVVDKGNNRIVKLNSDGLFLKAWGTAGNKDGEFNFAHSIVISNNTIYVADRENKRIQIFDLDGNYQNQWNDVGYPYVLTLSGNTIWMTDARSEKIQQLSLDGKILNSYQGKPGRAPHQFGFVHGIYVTKQGNIMLTQVLNWSVMTLEPAAK